MSKPRKKETKPVTVKTANLMQLFGVSRQTITNWRKRGMLTAFIKNGTWDLLQVVKFWAENIHYPEGNEGIASHRERWEKARADKLEFELAEVKKEHVNIPELQMILTAFYLRALAGLRLLPQQASIDLDGMVTDMPGVMDYLDRSVTAISDGLAENATPKQIAKEISKKR